MLALVDMAGHKGTPVHWGNRSQRRVFTWDSGRSEFGETAEWRVSLTSAEATTLSFCVGVEIWSNLHD
jgi:hypothetical protein